MTRPKKTAAPAAPVTRPAAPLIARPVAPLTPPIVPPIVLVSRETLEETPSRMLSFLRAIGTSLPIRGLMMARGYTADDHTSGWELLHIVSGFTDGAPLDTVDVKVRDAIVALDAWDEDGFRVVRAALGGQHPEQAAFVLEGIGPSVGTAAVIGVRTLLGRLNDLESSPARQATRQADLAALATLAKRGIDAKERARLTALVTTAESVSDLPVADENERRARDQAYLDGLVALRRWYDDWSEMARVAVKRRDYLIRLGLAKRKPPKKPKGSDAAGKDPTKPKADDAAGKEPAKAKGDAASKEPAPAKT